MESLGNGRRVAGRGQFGSSIRQRLRRRFDHALRIGLIGLLCLVQLAWGITYAQSTRYVYDANGRVVAVTANNGTSAQYSYNALGHASQISTPVPAEQLAIFAFAPTHGQAGTQVTIQGQGFDSNAAHDTVSFNGTVATVLAASTTQLVVAVPNGVTTGPISVSAGGQTAGSATPFVIDNSDVPPTITQASPAIVSIGDTVTVTGTHLAPVVGGTAVQMGGRAIPALAVAADTQLQYVVPSNGSSGAIVATTPFGSATSPAPVIVLPGGISASNVVSSGGVVVGGNGISLNIGASGQYGAVTFMAPASGWVSLQASGISTTASTINYTVYTPGNGVLQQGTVSATAPSIHLPRLVEGATYLVLIQPNGAGAQMTLGVEANTTLTTNGAAAAVVTEVPNQSERVVFHATAGQPLTLFASQTATNPVAQAVSYTVYDTSQQSVTSGAISSFGTVNVPVVKTTGTYQMVVAPSNGATGTVQLSLGLGNVLLTNGQASSQAGFAAGQSGSMTFSANAGDNVELLLTGMSIGSNYAFPATINVLDPHGTNVASGQCFDAWYAGKQGWVQTCRLPLWNLMQGTYTVVITPPDSASWFYGFNASLLTDIAGQALSLNVPSTVTLSLGQVQRMTFNANAGDNLALAVANVSTTNPSGQPVQLAVYRPDGSILPANPYLIKSVSGNDTVELPNLPVSGNYTVVMSTGGGEPGTAQLTLVPRSITVNGQTSNFSGYMVGQNARFTFTANAGDNLELLLTGMSIGSNYRVPATVNVLDANGTNVASGQCFDAWYAGNQGWVQTCRFPLWNLAQGTYSVVITPPDSASWFYGFSASLQPDTVGSALSLNTPATVTLALGQVQRMTFNANAGDNLALAVANVSTTNPSGQPMQVAVFRPDGSILPTSPYLMKSIGSSDTLELPNLPVTGSYTVVTSTGGEPSSAQLTLVPRSITANGQASNYSGYVIGQNARFTFTANAGDNLELLLTGMSIGSNYRVPATVSVLDANGTNVASGQCFDAWYAGNQGWVQTCRFPLWNLAQGTYSVVITPPDSASWFYGFSASLRPDTVGSALSLNTPATVTLALGQVQRMTFSANAGDNFALAVANVSTTNPSGHPMQVAVYRPDGSILPTSPYLMKSIGSSDTLELPNLPVTGSYTAVTSTGGEPGSAQLTLVPRSITANGQASNFSGYVIGQSARFTFTANPGDNLELLLTGMSIGSNYAFPATINVFDPHGTSVASGQCFDAWYAGTKGWAQTCRLPLWNLLQGTYTVVITPPDSSSWFYGFSASLQPDAVGSALSLNTPSTVTLALGQVERVTFSANAGDSHTLSVANVSTTNPSGQSVQVAVYRPDNAITSSNAYVSGQYTDSGSLSMTNLPVSGTYTVVVSTASEPGSAQLTLQ